jgi:hypothetical protein
LNRRNIFLVADNFFFEYYSPENFYVSKNNIELAKDLDKGLKEILKSGELLCIYKHYYGPYIQKANLKKNNKIFIGSPKSEKIKPSIFYLDFTKDYTKVFKDIEEKQMDSSECKSLIEDLRNRNKQLGS